jgi:hypothetical protein
MAATEEELRTQATERVRKRRDLSAHVVVYVIVNAGLIGVWAMTGGYFWPAWVLFCWGIGLTLNVWDVYFRRPVTEHDIAQEMDRLRG